MYIRITYVVINMYKVVFAKINQLAKKTICLFVLYKQPTSYNIYLSHIKDSFQRILKLKIIRLELTAKAKQTGINLMIIILIFVENCL